MTGFNNSAADLAAESRSRFQKLGWPGRDLESFHYTDLRAKIGARLPVETKFTSASVSSSHEPAAASFFDWALLASALETEHGALPHLILAETATEKVWQISAQGEKAHELKVQLESASLGRSTWRHRFVVPAGTSATIVEEISIQKQALDLGWTHLEIGEGAQVHYVRVVKGGGEAVNLVTVNQMAKSSLLAVGLLSGPALARESWVISQQGAAAESRIRAAVLANQEQHVDFHSSIRHLAAKGSSRQIFRSVLNEKSRGVFQGKILIAQDAQEVDSSQLAQNLLLGVDAEADTKPELEIYADNVKANHGATVGRLDEEQIYYLMSRGLSRALASQMIAEGFIKDSIKDLKQVSLRRELEAWLQERLGIIVNSGVSK